MDKFYSKLSTIIRDGIAVTIFDLEDLCDLPEDDHLGNLIKLKEIIDKNNLEINPPLNRGGFNDIRNLSSKNININIQKLIERGEGHTQEFKSTAFCNMKKLQHSPGLSPQEYNDENVLNSTLKTIAAFSNTDGGLLLIGVTDDGEFCGIENDFSVINVSSIDGWEQKLRERIEKLFSNGRCLNSFVKIEYANTSNGTIAVLKITKKPELDFLSYKDLFCLYIRQGNRTIKIDYQDIENYFYLEKKF